jgi:tetratricopeptide (TPR) repeat protein
MHQATAMIRVGRYSEAFKILTPLLQREPRHLAALCMAAQAQANAGCLEEAEELCHRAIEVSPFASLPYHLLARIAEERGDSQTAKALLKKVIYLNPESAHSYLELGAIYTREGDAVRAAQMQQTVHRMLDDLPEGSTVRGDEYAVEEPILAGELKRHLQIDMDESALQPL